MSCQPVRSDGHSHAVSHALAERSGCGLDARGNSVFRVPRSAAIDLAKPLNIVQGDRVITEPLVFWVDPPDLREIQRGVQQHRGMAIGENEAVAIGPHRICGVVTQKVLPQAIHHRRERHGSARMPGVRLLHGIHGQRSDGVDAQRLHLLAGQRLFARRHGGVLSLYERIWAAGNQSSKGVYQFIGSPAACARTASLVWMTPAARGFT